MGRGLGLRLSPRPCEVSRTRRLASLMRPCVAVRSIRSARQQLATQRHANLTVTNKNMASFGKILHPRTISMFVVSLACVTLLSACGGSSSETPPPLEPDPHALPARPAAARAKSATPSLNLDDDLEPSAPRARGTWGTGRARTEAPALAPAPPLATDAGLR